MSVAEQSRAIGLRAMRRLSEAELLDRAGVRKPIERIVFRASKGGFRAAVVAGRTFSSANKIGKPARQVSAKPRELFDLTPDDEQAMLCEAIRDFAESSVRPAALAADDAASAPAELLEQSSELGLVMLGVPEELGGVMQERSTTTALLAYEALAHGDMGIAFAVLAPAAVANAIGLWGSADQQSTYLPPFTGDDPPKAALALLEPRPLFDPMSLGCTARRDGGDWLLNGEKTLVAQAGAAELFVVAADTGAGGPALFIIEGGTAGLFAQPEPAMGLRAAATGKLLLEDVRLPAGAILAEGEPAAYAECVQRSRLAWCALAAGTAKAVIDYVIPYVNERVAFGEAIANRQAVAFAISDMAIEQEGIRLISWRAASRADQGRSFAREVALARSLVAQKGMKIGSDGVQLLGGHGFVKEHPVERWYRDLRAAGLMEGALLV